jgi:hypothetical protein
MEQLGFAIDLPTIAAPRKPSPQPAPRQRIAQVKLPTFGLIITDPDAHRIQVQHKARKCLTCGDTFSSHGPGNRICSDCKEGESFRGFSEFSACGF